MPYTYTSEEAIAAANTNKHRIEEIHILTPSDDDGNADVPEYRVLVVFSRFDAATGKKLTEHVEVRWSGTAVTGTLMAIATNDGEALGPAVKRGTFEQAAADNGRAA